MSYFHVNIIVLYRKQFPVCYIYKIEPKEKIIYLKFLLLDLKEIKIAFKEAHDSNLKLELPPGRYDLKYTITQTITPISDNYILSEGDRYIIFKFCWIEDEYYSNDTNSQYSSNNFITNKKQYRIMRFILNVEYPRTEPVEIDYKMEIKFRLN
jgi:hypothetical protein